MPSRRQDSDVAKASNGDPDRVDAHAQADRSVQALARQAINRLAGAKTSQNANRPVLPEGGAARFKDLVLNNDTDAAVEMIETLRVEGRSYEQIAEALFTETARRLGKGWEQSELSFLEVNIGISTLLRINTQIRGRFSQTGSPMEGDVLFATLPHQSHTLGIILATEAFRQSGLQVELLVGATPETIIEEARLWSVRLVGLTAGHVDRLPDIVDLAARLKDLPERPAILLGGAAANSGFVDDALHPVDCVAETLDHALSYAEKACARLSNKDP